MKRQVIVIHGGETFDTQKEYLAFLDTVEVSLERLERVDWKDTLQKKLGRQFEVIQPQMPNKLNAKYAEWCTWFKKYVPLFNKDIILVGHSLGGIFLAKYLAENDLGKNIKAVFFIAAPFDDVDSEYSLADFVLPKSLKKIIDSVGDIFIYHSKDDPVVPFKDAEKYLKALPKAHARIFEDRQHINQESLPELVEDIKRLY